MMLSTTAVSMSIALVVVVALFFGPLAANAAFAADQVNGLPLPYPQFTSANYAGYVSIPNSARKSFYWFTEAENSPATAPLMLWLNGGPGCSSLLGFFTEIGPYILRNGGVWIRNPWNWNRNVNVLYVESPSGVGFSIDGSPATNWTDDQAAQLNYAFLQAWLDKFPEYKGRNFYIAGESYAGHYVPQLAEQIVDGPNAQLKGQFKGFMVGNPCTGAPDGSDFDWCFRDPDPTLIEYQQSHGLRSYSAAIPFASEANELTYDPYNYLVRACGDNLDGLQATWRRRRSNNRPMPVAMVSAEDSGSSVGGNNNNDNKAGDGRRALLQSPPANIEFEYGPCAEQYLKDYLRRADVIAAIHAVAPPSPGWDACSNIIYPTPTNITRGVLPIYQKLMETTALNLLVYSGTADTVVNFIQTQKILISLGRPVVQNFTAWYYQDLYNQSWKQLGGYYIVWDRVAWAGVRDAGHMVPTYVPAQAFQLLTSFLTIGKPGLAPPTLTTPPGALPPPGGVPTSPGTDDEASKKSSVGRDAGLVVAGIIAGAVVTMLIVAVAGTIRKRRSGRMAAMQDGVMME